MKIINEDAWVDYCQRNLLAVQDSVVRFADAFEADDSPLSHAKIDRALEKAGITLTLATADVFGGELLKFWLHGLETLDYFRGKNIVPPFTLPQPPQAQQGVL